MNTMSSGTSASSSSSSAALMVQEHGNPQSARTTAPTTMRMSTKSSSSRRLSWDAVLEFMSPDVLAMSKQNIYNIALVLYDCNLHDGAIAAIRSPVSTCRTRALVVLQPHKQQQQQQQHDPAHNDDDETTTPSSPSTTSNNNDADHDEMVVVQQWMEQYCINPETTDVRYGDDGFHDILQREDIDAVYIFVPGHLQSQYVLASLRAKKHVLLKDLVSTPSKDFQEQLNCAKSMNKFVQFSTMFVHHYRVQSFLNCVGSKDTFGTIQEIDAMLTIHFTDLAAVSVSLPLTAGQGCVRCLARYCVLITSLMLRTQHQPLRATVVSHVLDETSGEPLSAQCRVEYDNNVVLNCNVVYSDASTRQVLTVRSHCDKFATMTDFVVPHPDGLATYRVYNKQRNQYSGKMDNILAGECIDVPQGPPQNVTLWREFHALCNSIDQCGWDNNNSNTAEPLSSSKTTTVGDAGCFGSLYSMKEEAHILTESSLQTKRILMALDESVAQNGATIEIVPVR